MPYRFIILTLLLIVSIFAVFSMWQDGKLTLPAGTPQILPTSTILPEVTTIKKSVNTPPPLRQVAPKQITSSHTLTTTGVLQQTNKERSKDGKTSLAYSDVLSKAADAKLHDLFAKQYFEHISPDGKGPSDLALAVGYNYLKIGENLALGNFDGDLGVVTAWMNSPGHRANILAPGYKEIGIAVGQGMYEGRMTWIAVQEFGTSLSVCPLPSATEEASIQTAKKKTTDLNTTLAAKQKKLTDITKKLDDVNAEVDTLTKQANETIAAGNADIQKGNEVYAETNSKDQAQPYWDKGQQEQEEGRSLATEAQNKLNAAQSVAAERETIRTDYNNTVNEYNKLRSTTQKAVDAYNNAVQKYNTCAKQYE